MNIKICKVKGCKKQLRSTNKSGLCTFHYIENWKTKRIILRLEKKLMLQNKKLEDEIKK